MDEMEEIEQEIEEIEDEIEHLQERLEELKERRNGVRRSLPPAERVKAAEAREWWMR